MHLYRRYKKIFRKSQKSSTRLSDVSPIYFQHSYNHNHPYWHSFPRWLACGHNEGSTVQQPHGIFCGVMIVGTAFTKTPGLSGQHLRSARIFSGHFFKWRKGSRAHSAIPSPSNRRFGMCAHQNYLSYPIKHADGMALCAKPIRD